MDERNELIDQIVDVIRSLVRAIHQGLPREWLDVEITMPQFKTLFVLYCTGRATMGELADTLGTGVSTLTGIVDRLVDQGLVIREEDPHDRRVVVGRLTPAGVELGDRLAVAARDRMSRVLGQLSLDELRQVAAAMELMRHAAAHAGGPAASSVDPAGPAALATGPIAREGGKP